jgi:hypothetical protein
VVLINIAAVKGVEELSNEFALYGPTAGFLSSLIAVLYFFTVYGLERVGSSTVCKPWIRKLLADYAYVVRLYLFTHTIHARTLQLTHLQIGTLFWTGFVHFPGPLREAGISMVPITKAFYPTQPRGWLIHFWELEVKWVFAALPFGFLIMLLFYYDHVCCPRPSLCPSSELGTCIAARKIAKEANKPRRISAASQRKLAIFR